MRFDIDTMVRVVKIYDWDSDSKTLGYTQNLKRLKDYWKIELFKTFK